MNESIHNQIEEHNRRYCSLRNRIAQFFGLGSALYFEKIAAPHNFNGVPPSGMTWKETVQKVHPVHLVHVVHLQYCPVCSVGLVDFFADFDEDLNQYMVRGEYCPKGHYTYLDYA